MAADPIARPAAAGTVELADANTRVGSCAEDGYGNGAAMEIRERFPQPLGNLAQNARFPHSHSRLSYFDQEEQKTKNTDRDTLPCQSLKEGLDFRSDSRTRSRRVRAKEQLRGERF
jgi:hypothetical protein